MILDSFKPFSLIFQIKYADAYLLWDRAGIVSQGICKIWPNLVLKEALPKQQVLTGEGVTVQTGLTSSTITLVGEKVFEQKNILNLKETVELWRDILELGDLTRVSTRTQFIKKYSTLKEANVDLLALNLVRWPKDKVFDQPMESDRNGLEIAFRFEDSNAFAVLRLKAEELKVEVDLDGRFFDQTKIEKSQMHILIDFDRGLLGATSAAKFRADEWIKGYQHLLRRDIEKILKGAK